MKTRRINLCYDESFVHLEASGFERPTLRISGKTEKGGSYEVVMRCSDGELSVLARAIRAQFKQQRANELKHADWREEPFKP